MHEKQPCCIALLRPAETGWIAYGESLLQESTGDQTAETPEQYNPYVDKWIGEYRERVEEVADDVEMPVVINEYQMHQGLGGVPGVQRRRSLKNHDIVTTLDPTESMWAFIVGYMYSSPLHRSVLAFSSHEAMEDSFAVLGAMKLPCLQVITEETRKGMIIVITLRCEKIEIPRCFAFHYQEEDHMQKALRQALLYPHDTEPLPVTARRTW